MEQMLSTSVSSTGSDYFSSSDIEDDESSLLETFDASDEDYLNKTGFDLFSSIDQSSVLLQMIRENDLSDEIFIRSSFILREFLLRSGIKTCNKSILLSVVCLATKLVENSDHWSLDLLNHHKLISQENLICNVLDWDIDFVTPIHWSDRFLQTMDDASLKSYLREIIHRLIVVCLTDISCSNESSSSIGITCALTAFELVGIHPNVSSSQMFSDENEQIRFQKSSHFIRKTLEEKFNTSALI